MIIMSTNDKGCGYVFNVLVKCCSLYHKIFLGVISNDYLGNEGHI